MVLPLTIGLAATASAAAPTVVPLLAPADAQAQYAAFLSSSGAPEDGLACETVWPKAMLLCFQLTANNETRWVTQSDLRAWDVGVSGLAAQVAERGKGETVSGTTLPVDGMPQTYEVYSGPWAAMAILEPERVAAKIGSPFLAAVPVNGTVLAWRPGSKEFNQIIAVGVREMFESQDGPVTSVIFQWTGERWAPFAEALPRPQLPPQ